MKEVWKDIQGYEGLYQVSNTGKIKSFCQGTSRILKTTPNNCGYYKVELYKNKKGKMLYIHRLVALSFIDNPQNKTQVNHIDGNKANNSASNLEWLTASENQQHAIKNNLHAPSYFKGRKGVLSNRSKEVMQLTKDGQFVNYIYSITEAAISVGCKPTSISQALNNKLKTCRGYVWRYGYN